MTEDEWLGCNDPTLMLEFLQGKASDRKFRLFACGCCWRIWHLLSVNYGWVAAWTAESHADGLVGHEELKTVRERGGWDDEMYSPDTAAFCATWPNIRSPWAKVGVGADDAAVIAAVNCSDFTIERIWQSALARDIFGNPFRPSLHLTPAILARNDGTVRRIAQGIYKDRRMPKGTFDPGRLVILHDALLEAGCDDAGLLTHLRSEGPHVRGCWALDQLLAKE